jgi:hypothetical protein
MHVSTGIRPQQQDAERTMFTRLDGKPFQKETLRKRKSAIGFSLMVIKSVCLRCSDYSNGACPLRVPMH